MHECAPDSKCNWCDSQEGADDGFCCVQNRKRGDCDGTQGGYALHECVWQKGKTKLGKSTCHVYICFNAATLYYTKLHWIYIEEPVTEETPPITCRDKFGYCLHVSSTLCAADTKIRENCPLSCNECTCADAESYCRGVGVNKLCKVVSKDVQKNCRFTCGLCA